MERIRGFWPRGAFEFRWYAGYHHARRQPQQAHAMTFLDSSEDLLCLRRLISHVEMDCWPPRDLVCSVMNELAGEVEPLDYRTRARYVTVDGDGYLLLEVRA